MPPRLKEKQRKGKQAAQQSASPTTASGGPTGVHAQILGLQQTAGNAAVAGMFASDLPKAAQPTSGKRIPSKEKWATAPLNNDKRRHDMPESWGAGALHHKISKVVLSGIAEALSTAHHAKSGPAREFWNLCAHIAGPEVVTAAGNNPHKLLWNLAVNLSIGPPSPVGDPGTAFDPDTEPDPDDPSRRRMDAVSAELKRLEDVWVEAGEQEGGADDRTWQRLGQHLRRAHELSGREPGVLSPPKQEQWVHDPSTRQHMRKGLSHFPGAEGGKSMFAKVRSGVRPEIAAYAGSDQTVAEGVAQGDVQDERCTLTLTLSEAALHHICERHTIRHFDFAQGKAVNTFWPEDSTFESLRDLAGEILPDLTRLVLNELIENGTHPVEWTGQGISLRNQRAGGHTVFCIGKISTVSDEGGEWKVECNLDTLAPDGASARTFTKSELEEIAGTAGTAAPEREEPTAGRAGPGGKAASEPAPTGPDLSDSVQLQDPRFNAKQAKQALAKPLGAPLSVREAIQRGGIPSGAVIQLNGNRYTVTYTDPARAMIRRRR